MPPPIFVAATPPARRHWPPHPADLAYHQVQNDDDEGDRAAAALAPAARPTRTRVHCPPNAHFSQCGAACVSSCTEVSGGRRARKCASRLVKVQPACKRVESECIATCVCNEGFVQVSPVNTSCVPARECLQVSADDAFSEQPT